MRYLSMFSGIEAATVAWHPLGWEPVAFAEVDKAACAVLSHYYPNVPNLGDVTKITKKQIVSLGHIDLVVFGFPCQDLSIAGKRVGLKGKRSGLFFDAMRVVRWSRARWAVAENVPGLFSSNSGQDLAAVVGEMAGVRVDVPNGGWANSGILAGNDGIVEWTTLDAKYFGVPQRRRRVFLVRDTGDWQRRGPLFLIPYRMSGHPAPSREARQGIAGGVEVGPSGGRLTDTAPTLDARCKDGFIRNQIGAGVLHASEPLCMSTGQGSAEIGIGIGTTLNCNHEAPIVAHSIQAGCVRENPSSGPDGVGIRSDGVAYTLEARAEVQAVAFSCKDHGADAGEISPTLRGMGHDKSHANAGGQIAVAIQNATRGQDQNGLGISSDDTMYTLDQGSHHAVAAPQFMAVRRLTPCECERLQGFTDDYTLVPNRGKPMADGPRYKMLGNSMAVPCMVWIGKRIMEVE